MSEVEVFEALKYHIKVTKGGTRCYYNNAGELHRDEGPAVEWADGSKGWFQNGQYHRTDGAAVEYSDGDKDWYINGEQLTEAGFNQAINPSYNKR
jgi:hypothetical protein